MLSAQDKDLLLRLARRTLEEYLESERVPEFHTTSPDLLAPRAVFVTLWDRASGDLRGCRGESVARRSLVESVMRTAIASATDDPRFRSVTVVEVPRLRIEISALTPLAPIQPDAVILGRHGLMIARGGRSGLLLPDVPTRLRWSREDYLINLCRKAGLEDDAWQDPESRLLAFEAEVWAEPE